MTRTTPAPVAAAGPMPATLMIAPGCYMPALPTDCTQPGLYQIWTPVQEGLSPPQNHYRIVHGGDAYALASAAAWLVSFGWADRFAGGNLTTWAQAKAAKALTSQLNLACGDTAYFLRYLAGLAGMQCRIAHVLTAETPITAYSDGHALVEILTPQGWKAFDSSLCYAFRDCDGNLLNLADACIGLQSGSALAEPIAAYRFSAEPTVVGTFSASCWNMEYCALGPADVLPNVVLHDYQIPALDWTDGKTYFFLPAGTEARRAYVEGLGYIYMTESAFRARFYL
jgi:hypothetical protein